MGHNRNLTTLTAATLFLHPHCQVLNHAGVRIYKDENINFLSNYSKKKFDRFLQVAIEMSGGGGKGAHGGSITLSHAFDSEYKMKSIYEKTDLGLIKEKIKCLFWKESLRTSNFINENQVDLSMIFNREERLRFLHPIRNPLDCAVSNIKTGHANIFQGLDNDSSVFEVTQAILDEIFWFAELKEDFTGRFFYFFEHELS